MMQTLDLQRDRLQAGLQVQNHVNLVFTFAVTPAANTGKFPWFHGYTVEITLQHQSAESIIVTHDYLLQFGIVLNLEDVIILENEEKPEAVEHIA